MARSATTTLAGQHLVCDWLGQLLCLSHRCLRNTLDWERFEPSILILSAVRSEPLIYKPFYDYSRIYQVVVFTKLYKIGDQSCDKKGLETV